MRNTRVHTENMSAKPANPRLARALPSLNRLCRIRQAGTCVEVGRFRVTNPKAVNVVKSLCCWLYLDPCRIRRNTCATPCPVRRNTGVRTEFRVRENYLVGCLVAPAANRPTPSFARQRRGDPGSGAAPPIGAPSHPQTSATLLLRALLDLARRSPMQSPCRRRAESASVAALAEGAGAALGLRDG